jgi:hypothetical protein
MRVVGRWGDRQKLADQLDAIDGTMIVNKRDHLFEGRQGI